MHAWFLPPPPPPPRAQALMRGPYVMAGISHRGALIAPPQPAARAPAPTPDAGVDVHEGDGDGSRQAGDSGGVDGSDGHGLALEELRGMQVRRGAARWGMVWGTLAYYTPRHAQCVARPRTSAVQVSAGAAWPVSGMRVCACGT